MFTPISLYQLKQPSRESFVDNVVGSFRWLVFLFQGSPWKHFAADDVALRGEEGASDIALVDFAPTSNSMRLYLYGSWAEHCPAGVPDDLKRMMQGAHEKDLPKDHREALERVFYSCLFRGDDFQPSVAVANVRGGFLVRRGLGPRQPPFPADALSKLLQRLKSGKLNDLPPGEFGKELLGYEAQHYTPRNASSQSLAAAFADFYDAAEDALGALSDADVEPFDLLQGLNLETTPHFCRAFRQLGERLQAQTVEALTRFRTDPTHRALGLEKISVNRQVSLWRFRISRSCRVHFRRSVQDPLLVNVGAHRLFEHGIAIG